MPSGPPLPSASSDCTMWKPVFCASFHGSMKARMRARLYSLEPTVSATAGATASTTVSRCGMRAPATNSMTNAVKTSRLAVPMSGSRSTRNARKNVTATSGKTPVENERMRSPFDESAAAR